MYFLNSLSHCAPTAGSITGQGARLQKRANMQLNASIKQTISMQATDSSTRHKRAGKHIKGKGRTCSVHNSMVARQRHAHNVGCVVAALSAGINHHLLLGAAHLQPVGRQSRQGSKTFRETGKVLQQTYSQDAGLGRVNDGREGLDAKHAQVGDGKGAPLKHASAYSAV